MANPAPTINQINAFNATQGTTIDFNIIGGTELVRSNKIYIYDLSDNSLICTHLYVSTESIHELPANTDSSIVYESGKSSADFVNGAQYYAQIQTYTDTAGTQGGSGLSVAKMFWCLVDPTLTITTIPSTISTTSYNVSATYTDTSASVVSNIIQQYQFNLYSAVGSLLQSSGVVVGSGTQQGTSDVYDISYNFTGLNVGSSYYVTVEVTTTQGMSVSAQSSTFTVSIETPTLGEATVVNNACDGYISVTSNLSSEYGGSASGEIASFVTDSVNNISSLKVPLEPIQDLHGYDAPWVGGGGANKIPFESVIEEGWTTTLNGITATFSKGYMKVTGTSTSSGWTNIVDLTPWASPDFFYLPAGTYSVAEHLVVKGYVDGTYANFAEEGRTVTQQFNVLGFYIAVRSGETVDWNIPMMFVNGSTRPTTYAPYENICPISGWDEVGVTRTGKNLLPISTKVHQEINYSDGYYNVNLTTGSSAAERRLFGNWGIANAESLGLQEGQYIWSYSSIAINGGAECTVSVRVSPHGTGNYEVWAVNTSRQINADDKFFILLYFGSANTVYNCKTGIQFELGTTATTYEPYNGTTYTTTLPSTTYGGTLDLVSGELTVTHGIVDLGTRSFGTATANGRTSASLGAKTPLNGDDTSGLVCSAYTAISPQKWYGSELTGVTICGVGYGGNGNVGLCDPNYANYTTAQLQTALNGVMLVYPLATPTTYQLTPQQIQTLVGVNNVWSEQGNVELSYHIPITNLLVKRQDVDDVSGSWLTLYSQPITQASDMDFTFIDFTNQYGKTYKYALVPLLTQTQSGVEVEVEGGYTVSDEVQSVFDGVFIVDSTGSQKCKANVGYGNVDMNQVVGSITPIGAKYPIVITNSQNQYHNGSISGTIVPDDYYFNGNLSRIDMVNKRSELEQFLTNKRAKIIKDWNGNIWLVMIMDNVSCTFNNSYGMGIVNFSTSWVEVGDPTNQQDLQATGLINVGGV